MTNCRRIINKAGLFIALVFASIVLLAGYGRSVKTKKQLLGEMTLIMGNFSVQTEILKVFVESATRLDNIFNAIHQEAKLNREDGEQLMTMALHNLLSETPDVLEKIRADSFGVLFGSANLTNLREWLEKYQQEKNQKNPTKFSSTNISHHVHQRHHQEESLLQQPLLMQSPQRENRFEMFALALVSPILDELDAILKRMVKSEKRQHWRMLFEVNYPNWWKKIPVRQLIADRIVYDRVYLQLSVIRAYFYAGMNAYNDVVVESENVEKSAAAANNIFKEQKMANKLAYTAMHMDMYVVEEEKLGNLMLNVLSVENGDKLQETHLYNDVHYEGKDLYSLSFGAAKITTMDTAKLLAKGDTKAFAKLMGKEDGYVPDGPGMVMKYQLMQDIAALWLVKRELVEMQQQQPDGEIQQVGVSGLNNWYRKNKFV